jgi:hypothetical protein
MRQIVSTTITWAGGALTVRAIQADDPSMAGWRPHLAAVLAVCGSLVLALPAASNGSAARHSSPQGLYQALLISSIPDSRLPRGLYSASTGVGTPSSRAKRHHAVGEVDININSGDAGIIYIVFASPKDALADWKDANVAHQSGIKSRLPAPGFPTPSIIVNGSVAGNNAFGKKVTNGISDLAFVAGSVIVNAVTSSTANTDSGDVPRTIALGKLALRHLREVEARVSRH